jgi:hypothetical protein
MDPRFFTRTIRSGVASEAVMRVRLASLRINTSRAVAIALIAAALALPGAARRAQATTTATLAVHVPAAAAVGVPFASHLDLTFAPDSGVAWAGYQVAMRYDTALLKVDAVTPVGLAGCSGTYWTYTGQSDAAPFYDGCYGQNSAASGTESNIQFECVQPGAVSLHLVTAAESAPFGSMVFDQNAIAFPTTTVDASVRCVDMTTSLLDGTGADVGGGRVDPGTVVHAAVHLGDTPTPTGTVDFLRYATADCTGAAADEAAVPLDAGSASSAPYAAPAGFVAYRVHYNGDGAYPALDGACVRVTAKFVPSISGTILDEAGTDITGTIVIEGGPVHAAAAVSGAAETASGSVEFRRYAGTACSGAVAASESAGLGAGASSSAPYQAAAALSYRIHYAGDGAYDSGDSACLPLTVGVNVITGQFTDGAHQPLQHFTGPGEDIVLRLYFSPSPSTLPAPTGTVQLTTYDDANCTGRAQSDNATYTLYPDVGGAAIGTWVRTTSDAFSVGGHYSGDAVYPAKDIPCQTLLTTDARLRVEAPDVVPIGGAFTASVDVATRSQLVWAGFQVKFAYDATHIRLDGIESAGLAGCTGQLFFGGSAAVPTLAGCYGQTSSANGPAVLLHFTCLARGLSNIHPINAADDPINGSMLFDENATLYSTATVDRAVECGDDGDGITRNVDLAPDDASDAFSDAALGGESFGTIVDRGGLTVSVSDSADPAEGVIVTATGTGGPAIVHGCATPVIELSLDPGDSAEIRCRAASANAKSAVHVIAGTVVTRVGTILGALPAGTGAGGAPDTGGSSAVRVAYFGEQPVVIGGYTFTTTTVGWGSYMPDTDGDGLTDWVERDTGVYVSPSDTGSDPRVADTDGDGVSDGVEVILHGMSPVASDTDDDGCTDVKEMKIPDLNANDHWDFYSVPVPALMTSPNPQNDFRDAVVTATDAQAVFAYFKRTTRVGTALYEQDLNRNGTIDGIEYDRTVLPGGVSGPPDGAIGATEAQLAFAQFKKGYSC